MYACYINADIGTLVGILFIDIGNIYCFGIGLWIVMCKDLYQYHHFMYNYAFTVQIFDITPKSKEIVHCYLIFSSFQCIFYQNCHVLF